MSSDDARHPTLARAPTAASVPGADPAASSHSVQPDPMLGETIERYRIVRKLGEGGMGSVYAAEHTHINKQVAIKLLRPEISGNKEALDRFAREARSASEIGHKNIIGIEDFGTLKDGRIFLFMELLDGAPLNELLDQGGLSLDRLLNILIQTGHGLAAAHAKGIVHRDMKPENIFVTYDEHGADVPKLLDFGIAKVSGQDGQNNLTRTGTIFGTPFYMAPEQALGQSVDYRADIYAMGVILYECFTGSVPFQGESFMGILTQHITAEPEDVERRAAATGRTVPAGIAEIIRRAMKKEPSERFVSMDEMVQALVRVYRGMAGAGMSSYMAAHVPASFGGPSRGFPQMPTPLPHVPTASIPTPMPYAASTHPPAATPHPAAAPYPDDSYFELPQKRSSGAIWLVLLVLLAAGGVGGYVLWGRNAASIATTDAADGGGIQRVDYGTRDPSVVTPPVDDSAEDVAQKPPTEEVEEPDTVPLEEPVVKTPPPEDEDVTPELAPVTVLVASVPPRAVVYREGKRLDRTPTNVKVVPGESVTLVLRRPGWHDEEVVIDGSSRKLSVRLTRHRRDPPPRTQPPKADPVGGEVADDPVPQPEEPADEEPEPYDPASELE